MQTIGIIFIHMSLIYIATAFLIIITLLFQKSSREVEYLGYIWSVYKYIMYSGGVWRNGSGAGEWVKHFISYCASLLSR